MRIHKWGTVHIHELGLKFDCHIVHKLDDGEIYMSLGINLKVTDIEYVIAAEIIAQEIGGTVIWQNSVGKIQFTKSEFDMTIIPDFDPNNTNFTHAKFT